MTNIFTKIKLTFNENKIISIGVIVSIALAGYAIYKNPSNPRDGSIFVEGVCLKKITKDRYKTEIVVEMNDEKSSAIALTKSKELYSELIDFTNKLKDTDNTIETETARIEVVEDRQWSSKTETYIDKGFNAIISLEISTENPETLDKVIAFASTKKDMLINGIQNYVSPQKMKIETENCLAEAIANAKSKAKSITDETGDSIGKLLSANISSGGVMPQPRGAIATMGVMNFKSNPEIMMDSSIVQSASYDLNVHINATFQIK
ncbi:MAG: SIMPL domain-containing protein [Rickettsiales bacterium]|jgi:uncharacterized protein YggE|nr:SIMPL domain-containing protein [Rickettsiales bacterium]